MEIVTQYPLPPEYYKNGPRVPPAIPEKPLRPFTLDQEFKNEEKEPTNELINIKKELKISIKEQYLAFQEILQTIPINTESLSTEKIEKEFTKMFELLNQYRPRQTKKLLLKKLRRDIEEQKEVIESIKMQQQEMKSFINSKRTEIEEFLSKSSSNMEVVEPISKDFDFNEEIIKRLDQLNKP